MKPLTLMVLGILLVCVALEFNSPTFWRELAASTFMAGCFIAWELIAILKERKR